MSLCSPMIFRLMAACWALVHPCNKARVEQDAASYDIDKHVSRQWTPRVKSLIVNPIRGVQLRYQLAEGETYQVWVVLQNFCSHRCIYGNAKT